MPFIHQRPRPFTRADLEGLHPNQRGVYGLLNRDGCVYVGKGDIRQRLLAHLNGDNPCISSLRPTHWVGEVTPDDPSARERELIGELRPSCNMRLG